MSIIVAFTIIYCSGYFYTTTFLGSTVSVAILALCLCLMFFKSVLDNKFKMDIRKFIYALYYSALVVFYALAENSLDSISTIRPILIIFCALFISSMYSFETFRDGYVKAMSVIVIFAIAGYVISFTPLVNMMPTVTNYNDVSYAHCFIDSHIIYGANVSTRLHGIAWEPGVFATYISLAILFCKKEKGNTAAFVLRLILFSTALILTMSGAGIIMIPILIAVKIFENKGVDDSSASELLIFMTVAFILGLIVLLSETVDVFLRTFLFSKLDNVFKAGDSARLYSVIVDFKIFWKHFPFGCGTYYYTVENNLLSGDTYSASASTLTAYIAQFGLFGIPITLMWIKAAFTAAKNNKLIVRIGTALIFLFILSKEPHYDLLFMNIIFMYFAFNARKSEENELKEIIS